MTAAMGRLRFTKLLILTLPLVAAIVQVGALLQDQIEPTRVKRDVDGATTVLLVSAQPGKSSPPVGVLSKTARTFVQDGASTEYATQILGTTLDNGRLYARILSTSSRVFYDKETSPDSANPYLVYPSQSLKPEWQFKFDLDNAGSQNSNRINKEDDTATTVSDINDFSPGENDIINKSESPIDLSIFKPAKVRPADNLATYTVKQEYVLQGKFDTSEEEEQSAKSRIPKVFRSQPKISTKKPELRNLATVTYHGFADFTTTVGDTVIVFSPSTSSALAGRPATTIKGDATLRPNDGVAVMKIRPTTVHSQIKPTQTFFHRNRGQNDSGSFRKSGKAASINSIKIQPSLSEVGSGPKVESTTPLLYVPGLPTESLQPTGLLEVVDSTTSTDGTTTHFKSMIYGTYVDNNYKQIIHTSSYVYFYPDETTAAYGTEATTEDYTTTDTTETDLDSTITTMGTTPSLKDLEEDDLTTPYEETTEANPTTAKNLFNLNRAKLFKKTKPDDNEVTNDILPNNQLGRSVQRGSPKNNVNSGDKDPKPVSLSTRIVPSTLYTTFTYFTTFFFSDSLDHTTTSVKSREVVSSEVSYLPEVILPTATQTVPPSGLSTKSPTININNSNTKEVKQEDEQIELIFKTLYTTYTYLTTFFEESTTSISSREVIETNVITQTVGPSSVSALFSNDISLISPTKIAVDEASNYIPTQNSFSVENESTEESLTTVDDLFTTISDEAVEDDKLNEMKKLEPSFSSTSGQMHEEYLKTYYTTYTYFTTIFVDDETEIETRTEVFSNIVTENIKPTAVVPKPVTTTSVTSQNADKPNNPPPEILAYLEALKKKKSQEEALTVAKKVQEKETEEKQQPFKPVLKGSANITTSGPIDGEVLSSMVTDVVSSSSSGGETLIDISDKKNMVPEDQELSESNHHDVEPVPTLLLQTSYTTFTYFTTMYKGDASNVVSRLETVTNVVTETIRPSVVFPEPSTTLPVTYFTTFTYWTTFYKGGDTVITSREETVSNVVTPGVTPTPSLQLDVVKTYRPFVDATPVNDEFVPDGKVTEDNELPNKDNESSLHGIPTTNVDDNNITPSTVNSEPATVYTTFTYFTTSYVGDSTVVNSRLETITNVLKQNENQITGRAIGGAIPTVQVLSVNEKPVTKITPSSVSPTTGLISTIRSSLVNDGTTTHYMTDVIGTYIDGLYAQVVQSSTKLETPPTPSLTATPTIPSGILSLNKGSIVDADEVTTVYYTTKEIGTLIDGLYAKVIESSTSTNIDSSKLATLTPTVGHRTGLVRLIKGQIEVNDTTIFYQSKVIGTSIENRYAQIIESTSSYVINPSTVHSGSLNTPAPHLEKNEPAITPSPAVVQSSLSDESTLDNSSNDDPNNEGDESENGEETDDEDDDKSTKKSRLTFSSRKRTFTPVIRPFASRARPTFNPKRKNVQGAATITRTDITPTITATLAGKSNRFSSSRGRVSSPIGPYSSTLNPSNARRFSGRRSSTLPSSVNPSSSINGSSRTRGTPRISPSSSFSSVRRGPSSIRGSSARPSIKGSSSILGSSSRFRANIRPSSTLQRLSSTARLEDQEDNANEFTTTTLVTDDNLFTSFDQEGVTTTPPLQTTTENPRRSSSPLLRFRRPLTSSARQSTTPRSTTTTAASKRGFTNKKNVTNPQNRASSSRGTVKATSAPPSTRLRQSSNGLFPPRGFLSKKTEETPITPSDVTLEDNPVEEITDNDYEGSENEETPTSTVPSRKLDTIKIRPFSASYRARRFRRQVSQLRPTSHRFRRPATYLEERMDSDVSLKEDTTQSSLKNPPRFGNRGRSLSTSRPSFKPSVTDKSDEYDDHNQYYNNQMNLRDRSKPGVSRNTAARINPTATVGSNRQFTLREKDSSSAVRSTYKRPSTLQTRGKTDNLLRTRTNARTRTGSVRTLGETTNNRRLSSSRTSGRNRNNGRIRSSTRGKNSFEDIRQAPFYEPDTDGTITVTHYVPTEVTIPVVNKGVTEHRNIITAQPSTEILGPNRYSTVIGKDGRQLVVIATESTGTNSQGEIEITRFLLHETPTTRVSHTLTTFGGRRASQSIIVPTTIYSVENIVSTIRPSLTSANAPLANILLSQLLLGQLGQQNPNALLQGIMTPPTPTTKFDTRTTTYVTTLTKHQSTVIPLTFRGKEILTTLVDTSTNVVTATEYITDTVVVTPTAVIPAANLNSLLYLLQQPQQPLLDPLFAAAPLLTQSNTLPGEAERRNQPVDFDYKPDSYEYSEEEDEKPKSFGRTDGKANEKKDESSGTPAESSVVTLYVSGKRPGEFSTVLSTVKVGEESTTLNRRRKQIEQNTIIPSVSPSLNAASQSATYTLSASEETINAHTPTESLESVVGDVGRHISTSIRA